jgi:hypothetical protein
MSDNSRCSSHTFQIFLPIGFNIRNKLIFYGEELLAPRPTPQLEDHPLSAVRDCLFNIFSASPPYLEGVSSIRNLRTRHGVVTRDPPNIYYGYYGS